MASGMSIAIGVFAAIGVLVVVWVLVRLPFWVRDIRREDRERERAAWAGIRGSFTWEQPAGSWTTIDLADARDGDLDPFGPAEYSTRAPGVYAVNGDDWQAYPS